MSLGYIKKMRDSFLEKINEPKILIFCDLCFNGGKISIEIIYFSVEFKHMLYFFLLCLVLNGLNRSTICLFSYLQYKKSLNINIILDFCIMTRYFIKGNYIKTTIYLKSLID